MVVSDGSESEDMSDEKIRRAVREKYAKTTEKETCSCRTATSSLPVDSPCTSEEISKRLGYSQEDIDAFQKVQTLV